MPSKASCALNPVRLQLLQPDNEVELAELRRQRILCGWAVESIDKWLEMIRGGDRLMYWIFDDHDTAPPPQDEPHFLKAKNAAATALEGQTMPARNPSFTPVGHIALDWVDYLGDMSLADRRAGRITFTSLYILVSKQGKGYASRALAEVEKIAKEELGCKIITLNTMPSRYFNDPEWWASQGLQPPQDSPGREEWYERKGYKAFLEVPRHHYKTLDGQEHVLPCVNMEKEL